MSAASSPTPAAPHRRRKRSGRAMINTGIAVLAIMFIACLASLPYTLGDSSSGSPRYAQTSPNRVLLPPFWAPMRADEAQQMRELRERDGLLSLPLLGTDRLGRDLFVRCLAGGGISLGIGLAAALIAVFIGTMYGTIAGASGGRIDAFMMRFVDVLFGLPYILLVVLLAVAMSGLTELATDDQTAEPIRSMLGMLATIDKDILNLITLLVAIGGVSWLTMARVIRGQVLSLKQQPFMEACRAIGVPVRRQFMRHLLPNLLGPIIVYATLTVPAAILSESFLSFLGIGVQDPVPSWGNLAAAGLSELNTVRVRWWLLLWPCVFIAATLLALNFVGEGLRERFDPKRN